MEIIITYKFQTTFWKAENLNLPNSLHFSPKFKSTVSKSRVAKGTYLRVSNFSFQIGEEIFPKVLGFSKVEWRTTMEQEDVGRVDSKVGDVSSSSGL